VAKDRANHAPSQRSYTGTMTPQQTYDAIQSLLASTAKIGSPLQSVIAACALVLAICALLPSARPWRGLALGTMTTLLLVGEGVLIWLHWRLWQLTAVIDPSTGRTVTHVAVSLWVESEKLYVWALVVALMGVAMRRQREQLLPGVMLAVAGLAAGGVLIGTPFTQPLPGFLGQYYGYLQATSMGGVAAQQAFEGMAGAATYYYNTWFMWVHPPLLFVAYGAFTISFVATLQMIIERRSSYETTAYRWARLGYLPITVGMLLGFPWALMSWQGEAWWWSGKVNMSIMMWMLYTAYLHARLYLRRRGMWKTVAALAVLSFLILVLTYLATYVVPGAHSYAAALVLGGVA
jgi:ABC-type transport system involved in cytochrome c biogenesis permease subunit